MSNTSVSLKEKRRQQVLELTVRGYDSAKIAEALGWDYQVINRDMRAQKGIIKEFFVKGREKILNDFVNDYKVKIKELWKLYDSSITKKEKNSVMQTINQANRDYYGFLSKAFGVEAPIQHQVDMNIKQLHLTMDDVREAFINAGQWEEEATESNIQKSEDVNITITKE